MANSPVEICNLAISWLGGKQIISLDDGTTEANLCKANYDLGRRAVLEERDWTFATRREQLTPLAELPKFGYSYKFALPPDFIRAIGVYNPDYSNSDNPITTNYVIEDNYLLANISNIDIKYIFNQIVTNRFSPLFDQTLAAYLGFLISIPLTQEKTQQERLFNIYNSLLDDASASNGLQGKREMINISESENARRLFVSPS